MNAINFLDNMDGIVGGVSAICALAFAALLAIWGWPHEALFALGLAGATLGFLRYNFAPARIFLGDTGSLFLGYALGALGLIAAAAGPGVSGILLDAARARLPAVRHHVRRAHADAPRAARSTSAGATTPRTA